MNRRTVTDDQISQALRAHLPDRAVPHLRERILVSTETTVQQRALPSFLGGLTDADPVSRRRSILLAAALLVTIALASAAAVGTWRSLHRDVPPELISLETPAEVQAFVFSSFERLPQLPPVAITTLDSHGSKDRIYVDRSGAVRLERFASADATEPDTSMLLGGNRFGRTLTVGSNRVWVEQDGAIGDDPRTYLRALSGLLRFDEGSDCAMTPSDVGDGTTAAGWRYVGAETVAGRPASHLACGSSDLWIDDATRLILRVRQPDADDAGNPVPGAFSTTQVTTIDFSEQPAALFSFVPPAGVAAMSLDAYEALCQPGQDTAAFLDYPPCSGTAQAAAVAPTPAPTPSPTPSPTPGPSDCAVPATRPSTSTGPLAWSQASLRQDWPAPVRSEPAGGASVQAMPPTYIDPSGDTGSHPVSCVDIRDVIASPDFVSFDVMSRPPHIDPSRAWIAYGVVVDEDRDGVPDWRYGIDNVPPGAGDDQDVHRAWRTDLHTGRTEYDPTARTNGWGGRGDPLLKVGDTAFGTGYPAGPWGAGPRFRFFDQSDVAGGGTSTVGVKLDEPFYVWASVIVDGRVVATDYAPDTGWLLPSADATPGGTYVGGVDGFGVPLRISMSLPVGWSGAGPFVGSGDVGLKFWVIDQPATPTCDKSGRYIQAKIGQGVDDLVTYLEGLEKRPISAKTNFTIKISHKEDVMVDGYRGTYLEYRIDSVDDCLFPAWPAPADASDNQQVWILDVDGVRLVIDGGTPTAAATDKATLQQIVDSIHIGP